MQFQMEMDYLAAQLNIALSLFDSIPSRLVRICSVVKSQYSKQAYTLIFVQLLSHAHTYTHTLVISIVLYVGEHFLLIHIRLFILGKYTIVFEIQSNEFSN